jgi:ABC-2 type transport system permease protein
VLAVISFAVLVSARGHTGRLAEDLAVVLFSALLAGWVVLPILSFSSDDLLDPARLALLPLSGRQLLTVLGAGAVVGVAPAATLIAVLGLIPATGSSPTSYLVAVVAVGLQFVLCVSASRASVAALSGLLRSRRGRDLGVALAALVGLSFQLVNPLIQASARHGGASAGAIHGLAGPLRWTPPGLLAAAPGRPLPAAVGSLLLVAAFIAVLLVAWQRSVRRSLERAEVSGTKRRRSTRLAPRAVPVPAGRTGAIMAKDLRYLVREPRRMVSTITSALLPVLAVVLGPLAVAGGRPTGGLVFAVCGLGLFGGLTTANRFGLDGTATWMLISSATDARDARRDLIGGDLATAVVMVPVMFVLSLVLAAVTGGWQYVPAALGLGLGLYAVGVALSGVLAVNAPFALPPSQNVFGGGGSGQGCTAGLLTVAAMGAELVICLPLLVLVILGLAHSISLWGAVLFVVGPIYGLLIGALIRRTAAAQWSARGPDVLQTLAVARH